MEKEKKISKKKATILAVGAASLVAVAAAVTKMYKDGKDFRGPMKEQAIRKVTRKYRQSRKGEVIFYGGTDFTMWNSLEEDIPSFKVQNHAFGGSCDKDLVRYSPLLLFPYAPGIVVFTTSYEDFLYDDRSDSVITEECIARKRRMFESFHDELPEARFVVLGCISQPGRQEYATLVSGINDEIKALCSELDYLCYVDTNELVCSDVMIDDSLFLDDGISLTADARKLLADRYIAPTIERLVCEMGEAGEKIRR